MAKAITGTFTITAQVSHTTSGYLTTVIPIGSLIDVGDAQALEIESVDYITQAIRTSTGAVSAIAPLNPFSADDTSGAQLMDRNVGTFLLANDNNLISSGSMNFDYANITTNSSDFYPDDFQKTNGRFVVNDELYLVTQCVAGNLTAGQEMSVSVRIRAKVVKLSTRDWMAISLETIQNE